MNNQLVGPICCGFPPARNGRLCNQRFGHGMDIPTFSAMPVTSSSIPSPFVKARRSSRRSTGCPTSFPALSCPCSRRPGRRRRSGHRWSHGGKSLDFTGHRQTTRKNSSWFKDKCPWLTRHTWANVQKVTWRTQPNLPVHLRAWLRHRPATWAECMCSSASTHFVYTSSTMVWSNETTGLSIYPRPPPCLFNRRHGPPPRQVLCI